MENQEKTNKEKMLAGELYMADAALQADHIKVQQLVFEYNQSNPAESEKRMTMLRGIFNEVGDV